MDFRTLSARQGKVMVSVGDSFTEGMCDDVLPDGSFRGWADRVAERLAADDPGLRYANLAVRGKLIGQIEREQVPLAAALDADLITLAGGLNDVLRPRCDIEAVEASVRSCCRAAGHGQRHDRPVPPDRPAPPDARLAAADAQRPPADRAGRRLRRVARRGGRGPVHGAGLRRPAACGPRTGCTSPPKATAASPRRCCRRWAPNRASTGAPGCRRPGPTPWLQARRQDLRWMRVYLLPWIGRRITGKSSGDGRAAKRPEPAPVLETTV